MSPTICRERLSHANDLINAIASHGRRFFYDEASGRVAKMELDSRGRVCFVDDFSNKRINTEPGAKAAAPNWTGFSHGSTLRGLIESLRDYILGGAQLPLSQIARTYHQCEGTDHWGYGKKARDAVRAVAASIPVIDPAR